MANLRFTEASKEAWAQEHGATNGTVVTLKDILPYCRGGLAPSCYETETPLSINPIGVNASCPGSAHYPLEPGIEKRRIGLFSWHWKVREWHELAN